MKDKLQEWYVLVVVDEFYTSVMCCVLPFCCEMAKVSFSEKEINSVLHCSINKCGNTIDHDMNGERNIYIVLEKMIQKERQLEAFYHSKNNGHKRQQRTHLARGKCL